MLYLQENSTLQGEKYKIVKELEQDSICITYQAVQSSLNRMVCVREFFMRECCSRAEESNDVIVRESYSEHVNRFKQKFLADAKSKARGEAENGMEIFDVFEENNTAYYVFISNDDCADKERVGQPKIKNIAKKNEECSINSKVEDDTAADVNVNYINNSGAPECKQGKNAKKSIWISRRKTMLACLTVIVAGLACAAIFGYSYYDSLTRSDDWEEPEDTLMAEEYYANDSLAYVDDSLSAEPQSYEQEEFERFINLSNEWLDKSKKNLHRPSNVQSVLNARFYYYDKAAKIYHSLTNEKLPANKEIDDITELEYQYWIDEAKKLGSDKSKYELKRTYLRRARSLTFRHTDLLDAQIKWLDEQLAKRKRR